jgi:hypothetical protein
MNDITTYLMCLVYFGVHKATMELSVAAREIHFSVFDGKLQFAEFKCLENTYVKVTIEYHPEGSGKISAYIVTDSGEVVTEKIPFFWLFPRVFSSATGCKLDLFGV